MTAATHRFNPSTKRIEPIAPEAAKSQNNDAIDAFIESDAAKKFLRDLLTAYEQSEGPEQPAEANPDESRVQQASTEQLRGNDSEEGPPEVEEAEPEEEPKRGPVAWRNGRQVGVGG